MHGAIVYAACGGSVSGHRSPVANCIAEALNGAGYLDR